MCFLHPLFLCELSARFFPKYLVLWFSVFGFFIIPLVFSIAGYVWFVCVTVLSVAFVDLEKKLLCALWCFSISVCFCDTSITSNM